MKSANITKIEIKSEGGIASARTYYFDNGNVVTFGILKNKEGGVNLKFEAAYVQEEDGALVKVDCLPLPFFKDRTFKWAFKDSDSYMLNKERGNVLKP